MRHTGGLKIDIDIPFFFWLFLIMAGIWYLFVFRVLCCHKTCGNSDVAIGMYIIETPVFGPKNYEEIWRNIIHFFLVHTCCDFIRNSNIEEGQIEDNNETQIIQLPPYNYIIISKWIHFLKQCYKYCLSTILSA